MIKLTFIREEDYWLIPISIFSAIFLGVFLWAGAMQIRLIAGLLGFSGLLFTTHIIRRGYSKRRSNIHLLIVLVFGIGLGFGGYLLTN